MAVDCPVGRRHAPAAPLRPGWWRRAGLILVLPWLAAGCATFSDSLSPIERNLAAERYDDALAALEKQSHSSRDEVLYQLNKGMLLRMKGDYAASNEAFETAKKLMSVLYATSVSETTASFIINDATRAYAGEEYEQVLVDVYKALNYLALGTLDDARVEVLQADVKLRQIAERLKSSHYADDAFARYIAGMIYEQEGEWSDALISYRQAYEAYKKEKVYARVGIPPFLKRDLLRLTEREGLTDENEKYRKEFGIDRWTGADDLAKSGELVFILNNGLAPILREQSKGVYDPVSNIAVKIALPYYQSRPVSVARVEISAGGASAASAVVEDIDAIARDSLDAKMPAIVARAVARQVVKVMAAHKAQQAAQHSGNNRDSAALAGLIVGLAMNIANVATERADTRSWTTLPREVQIARLPLPPGQYNLVAKLYNATGDLIATRNFSNLKLQAGDKTYVSLSWMPAQLPEPRRSP